MPADPPPCRATSVCETRFEACSLPHDLIVKAVEMQFYKKALIVSVASVIVRGAQISVAWETKSCTGPTEICSIITAVSPPPHTQICL